MLREEFEQLTGFYPTEDLYREIEAAYSDYKGDKQAFCKAYKKNENGMAEAIQRKMDMETAAEGIRTERESKKKMEQDAQMIAYLKAALELEQEWKPYEVKENVQQEGIEGYSHLAECGRIMSDEEAKDLIEKEWGFQRSKIVIHHTVSALEINRHNHVRRAGEIDRKPMYESTDWNYVRFDVAMMTYEMHNGDLRFFVH